LTNVVIGKSVNELGNRAFARCSNLLSVYFRGNAPACKQCVFLNTPATIYYLPGTSGWEDACFGRPAMLWKLQIKDFHVFNTDFTLTITGPTGIPIALEFSTNLLSWNRLFTTNLVGDSMTLVDRNATGSTRRFYRITSW
jgi:hypothetical protein